MADDADDKAFTIDVSQEVAELSDERLMEELETLARHEDANVLTSDQRAFLNDIRDEMYKRMSVGGPYADYTGPEDDD